jgi:hypothetical protein
MVPKSEILWMDASYHAIHQVLSNPLYAGVSASLWFCPKTSGLKLRSQDGSGAVD